MASFDVVENPTCTVNFKAKEQKLSEVVDQGYLKAVIALPDHMLYKQCMDMMEADFECILLEKPGATTCTDLEMIHDVAEGGKPIMIYMNY